MPEPDSLLEQACVAFGVTYGRALRPGGQKSVHLVSKNDVPLVLKIVATGSSAPTALERARREVNLLATTSNPHVVRAMSELTALPSGTAVAWLEEYLGGQDLGERLGTPWPAADVRLMGIQVAVGLGSLHVQHVVHRDLSPNNIRRVAPDMYKVMDPGFAKHGLLAGITIGGQPGTLGYLSPEHVLPSGTPTPASDVFCVAILMYAAATGQLPYSPSNGEQGYVTRLLRGQHASLAELRADLPDCLVEIIERAMHAQPARRFRNGLKLAEALEACQ